MSHVVLEISNVFFAVWVDHMSFAVHLIALPLTCVCLLAACPSEHAVAVKLVLHELAIVDVAVRICEPTLAVFSTLVVLTLVGGPVWPGVLSIPFFLVLYPVAGIFCTCLVLERAFAVFLVLDPFTRIGVPIGILISSFT